MISESPTYLKPRRIKRKASHVSTAIAHELNNAGPFTEATMPKHGMSAEYIKDLLPASFNKLDEKTLNEFVVYLQDNLESPPTFGEKSRYGGDLSFVTVPAAASIPQFNPAEITVETLKVMRKDPQIALALALKKGPISGLGFSVECENEKIKAFIDMNMKRIWRDLIRGSLSSFDFGFFSGEKVYERKKVMIKKMVNNKLVDVFNQEAIVIKKIKAMEPDTVRIRTDELGNISGFQQEVNGELIDMTPRKVFHFWQSPHGEEFGNWFGVASTTLAFEPWFWKNLVFQFLMRYMERRSTPPIVVRYPKGISRDANGVATDNSAKAFQLGSALFSNLVATLPSDLVEMMGKTSETPKWNIEFLKDDQRAVQFIDVINHFDKQIMKSQLIADQITDADLKAAAARLFLDTEESTVKDLESEMNKQIVDDLVAINFGAEFVGTCTINIDPVDINKKSEMRKLVSKILDLFAASIKQTGSVPFDQFPDIGKIMESVDIPFGPLKFTSVESVGAKMMEKAKPKNSDPGPATNKEGGINEANNSRTGRDSEPRNDDKLEPIL